MSTVDEILAAGWYTDKRGRSWRRLPLSGRWADQVIDHQGIHWAGQKIEAAQMRLLIERDQHVCHGLRRCFDHPVPHVLSAEWDHSRFGGLMVYPAGDSLAIDEEYDTLSEAMDAARALAVGE